MRGPVEQAGAAGEHTQLRNASESVGCDVRVAGSCAPRVRRVVVSVGHKCCVMRPPSATHAEATSSTARLTNATPAVRGDERLRLPDVAAWGPVSNGRGVPALNRGRRTWVGPSARVRDGQPWLVPSADRSCG